jgi:hypothetical protein
MSTNETLAAMSAATANLPTNGSTGTGTPKSNQVAQVEADVVCRNTANGAVSNVTITKDSNRVLSPTATVTWGASLPPQFKGSSGFGGTETRFDKGAAAVGVFGTTVIDGKLEAFRGGAICR